MARAYPESTLVTCHMLVATSTLVVDKDEGWRCEVHLLALFALELLTISSDVTLVCLSCRTR